MVECFTWGGNPIVTQNRDLDRREGVAFFCEMFRKYSIARTASGCHSLANCRENRAKLWLDPKLHSISRYFFGESHVRRTGKGVNVRSDSYFNLKGVSVSLRAPTSSFAINHGSQYVYVSQVSVASYNTVIVRYKTQFPSMLLLCMSTRTPPVAGEPYVLQVCLLRGEY